MNSFETLRGQIGARAKSSGFPSRWDVPIALSKYPEGVG